jgi:hypothetical protein
VARHRCKLHIKTPKAAYMHGWVGVGGSLPTAHFNFNLYSSRPCAILLCIILLYLHMMHSIIFMSYPYIYIICYIILYELLQV